MRLDSISHPPCLLWRQELKIEGFRLSTLTIPTRLRRMFCGDTSIRRVDSQLMRNVGSRPDWHCFRPFSSMCSWRWYPHGSESDVDDQTRLVRVTTPRHKQNDFQCKLVRDHRGRELDQVSHSNTTEWLCSCRERIPRSKSTAENAELSRRRRRNSKLLRKRSNRLSPKSTPPRSSTSNAGGESATSEGQERHRQISLMEEVANTAR